MMDSYYIDRTEIQGSLPYRDTLPEFSSFLGLKFFHFKMDFNLIPVIGLSHLKLNSININCIEEETEINIPLYNSIHTINMYNYKRLFSTLLYTNSFKNHLVETFHNNIKYYGGSGVFLNSDYKPLIIACVSINEEGYTFLFSDSIYKEKNKINTAIKNKIIPDVLNKGFKCIITNIDDYIKFPKMQFKNQEEVEKVIRTDDFINKVIDVI